MLTSELVTAIREATSDTEGTPRHSDAELFRYIGRVEAELYSLHPSAFFVDDYVLEAPPAPTSLRTQISVLPHWVTAIVHKVCYYVFMQDGETEGNLAMANEHLARWKEEI